ncbi:MAG: hypothetical protein A2998_01370 [Candidatus Staskawiczbacteria bacterium RIFCSPLOWO2_01_FULL_37_25b]|uniref:N-acetyltransferase domain-containing protein n=2 Tax=Candidatus Staskawicziibacteriota TaxID=1817916 RepID=A0A1G2HQ71_9BACT|nr:MAG: hypothetical protein A2812_02625 [Candidatus Staskawiczbacteria bacterium RIFCSPHIGHO2_01_FULL_36_16]OGZ74044.1 MAG: hypothetical protein A2998_01370 [Candidatus Staskawiczbacteria bacterium RIFCSPLOWO2_01_FULL_37_25b]
MSEIPRSEQPEDWQHKIETYNEKYDEAVHSLIFEVYEKEIGQHSQSGRPDLDKIPEVYQTNGGNFWVALDGDKVIGTIGLINQGEQRASLHRFCVKKEFRGKGVSDKLFSAFMEFVRDKGYEKIFLSTWEGAEAARKFYAKNGFNRIRALPEDMAGRQYFIHDKVFFELDIKDKEERYK